MNPLLYKCSLLFVALSLTTYGQMPDSLTMDRLQRVRSAHEFVSEELMYNEATVELWNDTTTIRGLYAGLDGCSLCLLVHGQKLKVPLLQIRLFTIEVEPKAWKGAITGMVLGDLIGNLFIYKSNPTGYLKNTKTGLDYADITCLLLGGMMGYLANPRTMGNQMLRLDEEGALDSLETRQRFVAFLSGEWHPSVHFAIEGGAVNTRQSRMLPATGKSETINLIRSIRLSYSLKEYLRIGGIMTRVCEPQLTLDEVSDNATEFETFPTGTLYGFLVEATPPRGYVPPEFDITAGCALGVMNIEYSRGKQQWSYWGLPADTTALQQISTLSPGASFYVSAGVCIHSGLTISLNYDYTFAFGYRFAEFSAAGLPSQALGNYCVGFAIGLAL